MTIPERSRSPSDRGAVTVEAAIVISGLVVMLALGASAITAVIGQVLCTDAAREAARVIARGEPDRAAELVRTIAPTGAQLKVHTEGDAVRVEVTATPAGGLLPGVRLRANAYAVLEPTGADP